jgi:hypothetical protein
LTAADAHRSENRCHEAAIYCYLVQNLTFTKVAHAWGSDPIYDEFFLSSQNFTRFLPKPENFRRTVTKIAIVGLPSAVWKGKD